MRVLALGAMALSLAACTTIFESDKVDYKSSKKATALDVPPDLTQLSKENRYAVPEGKGIATASGLQAGAAAQPGIGRRPCRRRRSHRPGRDRGRARRARRQPALAGGQAVA